MNLFSENIDVEDIALIKRLLHESRDGFIKLFNNSPVCMSMTSPTRVYVRVNKMFLEKFGYTESEIIGRNSVEVGILDTQESARVGLLIKEKGKLHNDYVKCIAKDGTIVHTVSSIELMEMNGEKYLISFFIDVSKIIDQQATIEQHAERLKEVNKDLEAFSYSVSHDLRAPLRAIGAYANVLEEDFSSALDSEGKRILTAIQDNAKKMGTLIDDLLSFAKLGLDNLVTEDINMRLLFEDTLIELRTQTNHKAFITVNKILPARGDLRLIKQVIINLLSNSIKYSAKKTQPTINIKSEEKNGMVHYTLSDNGAGFDMAYVHKLFGVFQRLHSELEFEGTGVGLATVKRIVNRHGGTVWASSKPGEGATFGFSLPQN